MFFIFALIKFLNLETAVGHARERRFPVGWSLLFVLLRRPCKEKAPCQPTGKRHSQACPTDDSKLMDFSDRKKGGRQPIPG
jgi:hypothetical protein